jgi:hypothetical protein
VPVREKRKDETILDIFGMEKRKAAFLVLGNVQAEASVAPVAIPPTSCS